MNLSHIMSPAHARLTELAVVAITTVITRKRKPGH